MAVLFPRTYQVVSVVSVPQTGSFGGFDFTVVFDRNARCKLFILRILT